MFLPITAEEVKERGWDGVDFVYVSGDAYVDHPSFGAAIITRVMEAEGYRGCFPQPARLEEKTMIFSASADQGSASWFPRETLIQWSLITRRQKSIEVRTHIPREKLWA